ncbi:enoyl-CoA hydratase-related protein [uncultured Comamonas sp.]|uniref:enoyl-CoA hydratase/isomerase family protein n=2 Tax=Comamonas TaxID=283 RepID=UPI000A3EE138|nr:enoyl-CoA hydratase-related protein [uncultured Comamonas sp.]
MIAGHGVTVDLADDAQVLCRQLPWQGRAARLTLISRPPLIQENLLMTYENYHDLKVEVANKVAAVTLNRPEARNAINQRLIRELRTIWDDLADDMSVNAVLLTGAGDWFSVGGDVKAMSERPGGDVLEEGEVHDPMISRRLVNRLLELDKPIVSAINGDCVGLAATIALLCDISVMADDARIGDSHVNKVGLVAGDGGTVIWPLLIGVAKAKEFLMRGTLLKGKEAERIGLVGHVKPRSEVLPFARQIAQELADGPTWATRWTKLSVNQIVKERVNHLLEASMALEQVTFELADHKEATQAFKDKRKPCFGTA